jgi:hypothetical protein
MNDEQGYFVDTSVINAMMAKANIELAQKVDKLIKVIEGKNMTLDEFIEEMRSRVLFETIDMDSDAKYLIRGVVESVLHDMKNTER